MKEITEYLLIDECILSKGEKVVHKYLSENLEIVADMSIYEFSEEALTSRATIDRYLKKIGINGFKELKIILSNQKNVSSLNEIELLSEYLKKNKNIYIGIVGKGVSFIAAEYFTRRLQTLGYFVHCYTYDTIVLLKHNIDLIIVISSRGALKSKNDEQMLKDYKGTFYAITAQNSNLANIANHVISNQKDLIQSKFERENMLSTIYVIEEIITNLIEMG